MAEPPRIDATVTRLRTDVFPATEEGCARPFPPGLDHIDPPCSPTDPIVENLRPPPDPGRAEVG
ncbi:hypothetical protein PWG71_15510 [Nocardiopsis sp. N85]|uniref:hypothetical protein n=1 Tax=Nocardiopsis sp. N85 TaxID=3029400 RepID=UPI00237F7E53|nr:hypothetical protein [Nocardiopsis sp. N85]MDE3722795.1 hypothetical protein [Nocardiopsis sp. N85]